MSAQRDFGVAGFSSMDTTRPSRSNSTTAILPRIFHVVSEHGGTVLAPCRSEQSGQTLAVNQIVAKNQQQGPPSRKSAPRAIACATPSGSA